MFNDPSVPWPPRRASFSNWNITYIFHACVLIFIPDNFALTEYVYRDWRYIPVGLPFLFIFILVKIKSSDFF